MTRRRWSTAALVVAAVLLPAGGAGQVVPVLGGRVVLGDGPLTSGTVVLHEVSPTVQGDIDSTAVRRDGTFAFELPELPDPDQGRMFFASIAYAGVYYFGVALTQPAQLDSVYTIEVYDSMRVSATGVDLPVPARNVVLDPLEGGGWRVTDIVQIRNDGDRTLVPPEEGWVWKYPLPAGLQAFAPGPDELAFDEASYEDASVVLRASIPPGERLVVMTYELPDTFVTIPTPGVIGMLDVLVRDSAHYAEIDGLEPVGPVELEPGQVYRRYNGQEVSGATVRIAPTVVPTTFPVEWLAVAVALALTAVTLLALQRRAAARPTPPPVSPQAAGREATLLEIARLDEAFHARRAPSETERAKYLRKREALLARARSGS